MEVHQLRYFVAVAQTGSFSRAAEQCHVSQPALSQQIQKLERSLGHRLFHRLGKRVALSEAGRLLLQQAQQILTLLENAERQVKDFDQLAHGQLTVGAIPTIAPYVLPDVIQAYTRRFPQVELLIHEDLTAHLVDAVGTGELDLALAALPIHDGRLVCEALFTEPLLLALPRQHPLAARRRIALEDLRDERFILLDEMHCLGEQILAICRHEGCHRIGCRSSQLTTVQALIALGQGISLLPEMARAADNDGQIVYRPLAGGDYQRTVGVIRHRDRYHGAAAVQFLKLLRERSKRPKRG
ncbi:MAG: LysR family transcriptional regulator [Pirellulales bacterium]|nr:LysR family transcriptional regulator [Pirellulales bacterium]